MVTRGLVASESEEQQALFQWINLSSRKYPGIELAFAVPNGQLRDIRVARKLQAEGVRPGVPDIFIPVARGPWHGLFIEMKRREKARVSSEQVNYMGELIAQDYKAVLAYGWEDAKSEIEKYMSIV